MNHSRPLEDGKVYHFNIIYNHEDSPLDCTEDNRKSLEYTKRAVSILKIEGYDRSYYHKRDSRPGRNTFSELFRVINESLFTIVILTPGFLKNQWGKYSRQSAFRKLLDNEKYHRLKVLCFGLSKEQVPDELCTHLVSHFVDNYEEDDLAWRKLIQEMSRPGEPVTHQAVNGKSETDTLDTSDSESKSKHPKPTTSPEVKGKSETDTLDTSDSESKSKHPKPTTSPEVKGKSGTDTLDTSDSESKSKHPKPTTSPEVKDIYRRVLNKNLIKLKNGMSICTIDGIIEAEIGSAGQHIDIKDLKDKTRERNEKIVDLIMKQGFEEGYKKFKVILWETKQIYLLKALEETEKKLLEEGDTDVQTRDSKISEEDRLLLFTELSEAMSKIPAEILQMDERTIELYETALEKGKKHNYSIRLMVTGPYGVGKSTLTKRLLCQDVDINARTSTDGIDVHVEKCKVSLKTSRWKMDDTDYNTTKRPSKVFQSAKAKDTVEESLSTENENDASEDYDGVNLQDTDKETDGNKDVKSSPTDEEEDHADVSVWDFAGQFSFYTTHHMFLSLRAIYILVIDMSQGIHAVVDDDEPYFDCSGSKSLKIEDFLDNWLNSIYGHSDRENPGTPKVILVGTHADRLNPDTRDEQIEAFFNAIRYRFAGKDVSLHFIDKDFGLSNAEIDPKLDDLRKTIMEVAKQQPYWGEMKPAKWIPVENLLEKLRRRGFEILSHSEVELLNQISPVPLTDDELELFLRFQHETASIMYFSVPELQNNIVLSPQFLLNALKSLITAEMCFKKKAEILDKLIEFRQKGILRTSLIDAVWNREENKKFKENREHILALMEHLNIIARPVLYTDDDDTQDHDKKYYLVPCMLKDAPPDTVLHAEEPYISTSCLCLDLASVAFPSTIFNRLLVACMTIWPLAKSEKKYHIYSGCGQFYVDVQHRLTLAFHAKVVSLRVTRFSHTNRNPCPTLCNNVYRTVKQLLKKISKCLSLVLVFEEYIKCPLSPPDSVTCMHSIEKLKSLDEFPCHEHDTVAILRARDLLRYWFELDDNDHDNTSDDSVLSSVLDPAKARRVPTNKELGKISKGIGPEFQGLFLELGISEARIGQIRVTNHYSVADQVVQLLFEWKKQRGCLATLSELEIAMNYVGTNTVRAFKDIK